MVMYKESLEKGDKIVLPPSALRTLGHLNIQFPMLFNLTNPSALNLDGENRSTHVGVMEFGAPEGKVFLPNWIMRNLLLSEGEIVTVTSTTLPKANFVKFRPATSDFLKLSNPRVVLETLLRSFSCVTQGDQLCIHYNSRQYYLEVREVKPARAASIIETDVNVDFEAPEGYEEEMKRERERKEAEKKRREQLLANASSNTSTSNSTQNNAGSSFITASSNSTSTSGSSVSESWGSGHRLDGSTSKKRKLKTRSPQRSGYTPTKGAGEASETSSSSILAQTASKSAKTKVNNGPSEDSSKKKNPTKDITNEGAQSVAISSQAQIRAQRLSRFARRQQKTRANPFHGKGQTLG